MNLLTVHCANMSPPINTPEPANPRRSGRGAVNILLDNCEARARSLVTIDELALSSGLSLVAVRRQMEHLAHRHARIQGKPAAYLLVPPEHRPFGAPPVKWWLDAYCRLRNQPYYLGLLSAAEMHGSSHQAVQVTQVLTARPMRQITVGMLRVKFLVKKNLQQTPVMQLPEQRARFAVSTPEATAIDLIAYYHAIGGVARAAEVVAGMRSSITVRGLRTALKAEPESAVKQRLGYVFQTLGWEAMAAEVQRQLARKLAPAILQPRAATRQGSIALPWNVIDNIDLKSHLK